MKGLDGIDLGSMRSMVAAFPQLLVAGRLDGTLEQNASRASRRGIRGLCLCGIGGSAIAGEISRSLVIDESPIPVLITRDYSIPAAVGKDWAVIVTSYSGNTEETLSSFEMAAARKATVLNITAGGELARRAKAGTTHLIPEGLQPRAALPLVFCGLHTLVETLVDLAKTDFEAISRKLSRSAESWGKKGQSPGDLARMLGNSIPLFAGCKHLAAVAYRAKCQICENTKGVSMWSEMPEASHNEIEASASYLDHSIVPIFLRSRYEEKRMARRLDAVSEIYSDMGCRPVRVMVDAESSVEEALAMTHYLDTVSVELADIRGVDSLRVDRIADLKARLARPH
ncbi:MAG: bifunctional phosphoglucose/phosphomannose isomerase [Candidatus Thorarchaeota archaeon]|nr:MAG: bifunctional phosphoglucose/phosphomannose isomerase [Candidatus Thorarchaeota archaeon]